MRKIWSLAVLMTMVCLTTGLQAEENRHASRRVKGEEDNCSRCLPALN